MTTARDDMVAAAERIAVERGLAAMSLREVQAAAGQRNKSAAQYHFGSRDGLIEAVIASRMGPVNARRLELLAALDADADRRALVGVLVEPLAEHALRPGSRWARFVAQGLADPVIGAVVARSFEGASYRDVHSRMVASLDHLPAELRARRVDHVVGLVVLSLAAAEGANEAGFRALPDAVVVAELVAMGTAVLDAPSTSATSTDPAHRPDGLGRAALSV